MITDWWLWKWDLYGTLHGYEEIASNRISNHNFVSLRRETRYRADLPESVAERGHSILTINEPGIYLFLTRARVGVGADRRPDEAFEAGGPSDDIFVAYYIVVSRFGAIATDEQEEQQQQQEQQEQQQEQQQQQGQQQGMVYQSEFHVSFFDSEMYAFNVDGHTMIAAEALGYYGFTVTWDGATRSLHINRTPDGVHTPVSSETQSALDGLVGTHAVDTDIRVFLEGELAKGLNTNGWMLIDYDELARFETETPLCHIQKLFQTSQTPRPSLLLPWQLTDVQPEEYLRANMGLIDNPLVTFSTDILPLLDFINATYNASEEAANVVQEFEDLYRINSWSLIRANAADLDGDLAEVLAAAIANPQVFAHAVQYSAENDGTLANYAEQLVDRLLNPNANAPQETMNLTAFFATPANPNPNPARHMPWLEILELEELIPLLEISEIEDRGIRGLSMMVANVNAPAANAFWRANGLPADINMPMVTRVTIWPELGTVNVENSANPHTFPASQRIRMISIGSWQTNLLQVVMEQYGFEAVGFDEMLVRYIESVSKLLESAEYQETLLNMLFGYEPETPGNDPYGLRETWDRHFSDSNQMIGMIAETIDRSRRISDTAFSFSGPLGTIATIATAEVSSFTDAVLLVITNPVMGADILRIIEASGSEANKKILQTLIIDAIERYTGLPFYN
jgi:hypothetical protein